MSRYIPGYGGHGSSAVSPQVRSTASVVAIIAAIVSFFLSGTDREVWGFIVALVAIGAGLIGGVKALSPRVSGGILSIMAVVLGVIALLFSVLAGMLGIVF